MGQWPTPEKTDQKYTVGQECICAVYIVIYSCAASDIHSSNDTGSPGESKKSTATARFFCFLLISSGRPVIGALPPVGRAAGEPVKIAAYQDMLKYPPLISGVIGRYAKFGAIAQNACQIGQNRRSDEPPLMMPAFWLGVWKQDKNPRDAGVRQRGEKKSGIIPEYSNIGELGLAHFSQ